MKFLRYLFLAAAILLVLAGAFLGAALSPRIQTWYARRRLDRADPGSTVQRVAVGFSGAEVSNLTYRQAGAVLTVPALHAEFPPLAAVLDHRLLISTLVAKGWTLDLRQLSRAQALAWLERGEAAPVSSARDFSFLARADAQDAAPSPAPFRGIFERLQLPFDLALGHAELEGDVLLPPGVGSGPARAHVIFTGGGLGAGQDGRFLFRVVAAPSGSGPVSQVTAEGVLSAAMDSPRTFTRLMARLNAVAYGAKFSSGVRAVADVGAQRSTDGESYSAVLSSETKPLLAVLADVPYDGQRPSGTWRMDLTDADLSPFLLGRELPSFGVAGQGMADADPRGNDLHITGSLRGTCDRLGLFRPELTPIGAVGVLADFDVTRRGSLWRVDRLSAAVQTAQPIFNLRSLQPFAFDADTGAFQVARVAGDLFNVNLQAIPAGWLQIFAPDLVLAGGPLHGSLVGSAGPGGLRIRTMEPLAFEGATVGLFGHNVLAGLDLKAAAEANYSPAGWEVDLSQVQVHLPAGDVASGTARLGRRRGGDDPLKVESSLHVQLPLLVNRPGLVSPLAAGSAQVDLTASWGHERVVQSLVVIDDLAAAGPAAVVMPQVRASIRADWQVDGVIALHAPIALAAAGRRGTDVVFDGAAGWGLTGPTLQGTISGDHFDAEDAGAVIGLIAGKRGQPGLAAAMGGGGGVHWSGELKLALGSAAWRKLTATRLAGTLRFFTGGVALDRLNGQLLGSAPFSASASLTEAESDGDSAQWHAHVTVQDLEASDFLGAIGVKRPNILEGRFRAVADCAGRGETPGAAIVATDAACDLTSAGGHFKLLATAVTPKTVAGNLALDALRSVANTFESVLKRHRSEFSNSIDATVYAAKTVSDIPYDQLSFRVTRSANGDVWCRDFALIAPEVRLQGQAVVNHQAGVRFSQQPLDATLELRARGKLADALKYLDVLEANPDDLGYRLCPLPIAVLGTLHHPDTSALQATLLQLLEGKGADLVKSAVAK